MNFGTNLVYTDEGKVSMYIQDELEWSCNYSMGAENGENFSQCKQCQRILNCLVPAAAALFWFIVIGGALVAWRQLSLS